MSLNENLRRARRQRNDEFYTQRSDIENELRHYTEHFRSKVVYCNCDDPRISNFFHYFSYNFERLGLKKLIAACYKNQERDLFSRHDSERAIWLEYKGNAVYAGPWVSDAKRHFSRKGAACPAYAIGSRYVNGKADRQEYLDTAIQWIKCEDQTIEEYMATHQHDMTATALWSHFQAVINRVAAVFPNYDTPMKGVDWGGLYGQLKDESLDPEGLEAEVARLMLDDDVTKKAGIYPYLLTGEEKHLNIRAFTPAVKQKVFKIQNGICKSCAKKFEIADMEADHITPWVEGGKTNEQNCQMLCKHCNRRKSSK